MLEGGYLRQTAGRLRNRAQSATPGVLRDQLLALAEYYDDMAADVEPPVLPAPAAAAAAC